MLLREILRNIKNINTRRKQNRYSLWELYVSHTYCVREKFRIFLRIKRNTHTFVNKTGFCEKYTKHVYTFFDAGGTKRKYSFSMD